MRLKSLLAVIGAAVATVSVAMGEGMSERTRRDMARLVETCKSAPAGTVIATKGGSDEVICDAWKLPTASELPAGSIQREIVERSNSISDFSRLGASGGAIGFLLMIPWLLSMAWRFTLARIREVSLAIRGAPPDR